MLHCNNLGGDVLEIRRPIGDKASAALQSPCQTVRCRLTTSSVSSAIAPWATIDSLFHHVKSIRQAPGEFQILLDQQNRHPAFVP